MRCFVTGHSCWDGYPEQLGTAGHRFSRCADLLDSGFELAFFYCFWAFEFAFSLLILDLGLYFLYSLPFVLYCAYTVPTQYYRLYVPCPLCTLRQPYFFDTVLIF